MWSQQGNNGTPPFTNKRGRWRQQFGEPFRDDRRFYPNSSASNKGPTTSFVPTTSGHRDRNVPVNNFFSHSEANSSFRGDRINERGRHNENRQYTCPRCRSLYSYRHSSSRHHEKIPLVLHCGHTVCQECIFHSILGNKLTCPVCRVENILSHNDIPMKVTDLQNIFPPNYYVIGVISYHKSVEHHANVDNIRFVSTVLKQQLLGSPSERCCFGSCMREATLYCPSCDGIFCPDCSTVVHKSTLKLMAHEPVPRKDNKLSFTFEKCPDHPNMLLEFFCKVCDLNVCCYCVLDKHSDHERITLYTLSSMEKEEFKRLKQDANKILREVLTAQKKAASLSEFNPDSVKNEISSYFVDLHGKLFTIEKQLFREINGFTSQNRGLDVVQSTLTRSAEELKQLISLDENCIGEQKIDFKKALEKLREISHIPRFLVNEKGNTEPLRFIVNTKIFETLDEDFAIEKCEEPEYKLVTEEELPDNFIIDTLTDSEIEGTISALLNRSTSDSLPSGFEEAPQSSKSSTTRKVPRRTPQNSKKMVEKVDVQHINSMDSFFVHYKNAQSKLNQLNKDIENYIKLGGAQVIKHPQINNLYLALYVTETSGIHKEQRWCRGRVVEIKNGETEPLYEVFFIDYGKTQTVKSSRIKDIPPFLQQVKPLAHECMLYNPMNVNWNKRAHYTLAKILNGKEVYMLVKSVNSGVQEVDLMISSSDGGMTSVIDILIHGGNNSCQSNDDTTSVDGSVSLPMQTYYPQVTVFPNSKKFVKNEKERVIIANIIDPHNIIVHMADHQESFKSMLHSLKKSYKNLRQNVVPIEGTYVLVEHRDPTRSNWHRAYIKQVDIADNQVHVNLLDWGLNVTVPATNVRPLQESFTKLECQAVLVKMADIHPFNKQSTWSSNAYHFLQAYFRSQDVLKMVVHDIEKGVEVALFDTSGQVDLCLNTMMVENNLADSTGPISTKLEWPQYDIEVPENHDALEEEGLMASLLQKANEEEVDSGEEDIMKVPKRQIDVLKVIDPNLILIKFLDLRERESNLFKELQVIYQDKPKKKRTWNVGETCVVHLDPEYARGKILELDKEKFKVYLVDKGEEIETDADKLYEYDTYFIKYTQIVLKCHLANIKPAGDTGNWSISSVEALQEIFKKHHKIFVHKIDDTEEDQENKNMPVEMWYGILIPGGPLDPDRIKYVSINNLLVKLGFAYRQTKKKHTKIVSNENNESSVEVDDNSTNNKNENQENIDSKPETKKLVFNEPDPSEDLNNLKSWNEIIEAEQKSNKRKKSKIKKAKQVLSASTTTSEDEVSSHPRPINDPNTSPYRKFEIRLDNWKPPFRLTNRDFQAKVTCAETGGHLFLHDMAIDEVYNKMEANIKEYFETSPPQRTNHSWEPGHLCTIHYEDGNWYRGQILKVISPQQMLVYMIDFGSDHLVSPDILYREILYTDISAFATKVKLDKVHAISGKWLTSDYDSFRSLVTDYCRIVVKGPLDVEIPTVEVYNEDNVFVNQKVIEMCPNLSKYSNFPHIGDDDDDDGSALIEKEEPFIDEVLDDSASTDTFEQSVEYVSCESIAHLKYQKKCLPKKLLDGQKVLMEIGGMISYNKIALKEIGEDITEDMYNLTIDIQDCVEDMPHLKDFMIDVPCVAQFSEDKVWYRARITSVKNCESGKVTVLFVDYGNSESVAVNNIRPIRPDWLEIPQQIWEAQLDIKVDETEAATLLQDMNVLIGKKQYIKLVAPSPLIVELCNEKGEPFC